MASAVLQFLIDLLGKEYTSSSTSLGTEFGKIPNIPDPLVGRIVVCIGGTACYSRDHTTPSYKRICALLQGYTLNIINFHIIYFDGLSDYCGFFSCNSRTESIIYVHIISAHISIELRFNFKDMLDNSTANSFLLIFFVII